jgi:hypothetical protein
VEDQRRGQAVWGGWHEPGAGARSHTTGDTGALMGGPLLQCRAAAIEFNLISNSNWFKSFKFLTASKMVFSSSKNLNKNMVLNISKGWTTFSIEDSSDSEWISNEKSKNSLG